MYGIDLADPTQLDERLEISNPYDVPLPCMTEGASDSFLYNEFGIQNLIIYIKTSLTGVKPEITGDGFESASVLLKYGPEGKKLKSQERVGLPLTGEFGEPLKRLIYQFQADSGLDVDGIVGPSTYKVLLEDRFKYHPCGEMPPQPPEILNPPPPEPDVEVVPFFKRPSTYILLLLSGVGGYYGYKYYQERKG